MKIYPNLLKISKKNAGPFILDMVYTDMSKILATVYTVTWMTNIFNSLLLNDFK